MVRNESPHDEPEEIVSQFRHLFSPGKISSVEITNRIIFSPMIDRLAHEDGRISKASLRYYDERAHGGAGQGNCLFGL
jgi:2,4-dienoyl-CoA reductase-like NADH-dependent reductase (Old Yellow Enzyme family)